MKKNREEVIADIKETIRSMGEYRDGASVLPKRAGCFHIATQVLIYKDTTFLDIDVIPKEIREEIISYAKLYQRDGYLYFYSSIGRADHTEMAKELSSLLLKNNIL